jgi:hypothetical protein
LTQASLLSQRICSKRAAGGGPRFYSAPTARAASMRPCPAHHCPAHRPTTPLARRSRQAPTAIEAAASQATAVADSIHFRLRLRRPKRRPDVVENCARFDRPSRSGWSWSCLELNRAEAASCRCPRTSAPPPMYVDVHHSATLVREPARSAKTWMPSNETADWSVAVQG